MREKNQKIANRTALETAFHATIYRVEVPEARFDLCIGQNDPVFDTFLREQNVSCWGIVTACNPGATPYSELENELRQKQLSEILERMEAHFFVACNIATDGTWPPEPAYLILQCDAHQLCTIAAQFSQCAVVYGELGQAPSLLWI